MAEPMSTERLAEIREVLTGAGPSIPMGPNALFALNKDRDENRRAGIDLLTEIDRLRERVEELEPFEPQLREMNMGPGGWSMTIRQAKSASGAFVAAAKAMLDGYDAENYVEQEVFLGATTKERYMIIYVRPGKKGPHQLRREADAQVEQLRQRIGELERDRARRPTWSDGRDLAIKFRNEGATDGEITEGFLGLWGGAK